MTDDTLDHTFECRGFPIEVRRDGPIFVATSPALLQFLVTSPDREQLIDEVAQLIDLYCQAMPPVPG